MRDHRDAKAIAQTLREELIAPGLRATIGQSLGLTAHALGAADWNTLAAAIKRAAVPIMFERPAAAAIPIGQREPLVKPSELTRMSLRRAADHARDHGHWGLLSWEHILLAMLDDRDGAKMMKGCGADLRGVRMDLTHHLEALPVRTIEAGTSTSRAPAPSFWPLD